jgi:hypothetical protein
MSEERVKLIRQVSLVHSDWKLRCRTYEGSMETVDVRLIAICSPEGYCGAARAKESTERRTR